MLVTFNVTTRKVPCAVSCMYGLPSGAPTVLAVLTSTTANSNFPSRTAEPAGATSFVLGTDGVSACGVGELTRLDDEEVPDFLASLSPIEPRATIANATPPTPSPIFRPVDSPGFGGCGICVAGPNGADGGVTGAAAGATAVQLAPSQYRWP